MADSELEAMERVLSALVDLDAQARVRVVLWINEKLDLGIAAGPRKAGGVAEGFNSNNGSEVRDEGGNEKFEISLASYLRTKKADGNQNKRFLVTADWLRRRKQSLSSGAVAKALADNHQPRLANPSECLNRNVAKGHCEKTKDGFFITPEGLKEIG